MEGTLSIGDFTNDTAFEAGDASLQAPAISLSFKDAKSLEPSRREAVEEAVGARAWPPRADSLLACVAGGMRRWASEFMNPPQRQPAEPSLGA